MHPILGIDAERSYFLPRRVVVGLTEEKMKGLIGAGH